MKAPLVVLSLCILVLSSCFSMGGSNPVYQSRAPEARGERAISSDIELVQEVNLDGSMLGVFYAHEVYGSGDVHTVLFTRRASSAFGGSAKGTMDDYDLSETASMSVDQARKFLKAIDNFSAMDPASMTATRMYNFELYSGTLDLKGGTEKYRPFQDITFVVVCSVTATKKVFKTVFPTTVYDFYGRRSISYATFELKPGQVKNLRDAVAAALQKSPPSAAVPADTSGT